VTPPDLKTLTVSPALFALMHRTLTHSIRAEYRVGDVIAVREQGTERELHVHLSAIRKAPAHGGTAECGLTVLPVDVRWNLLWLLALEEQGMYRSWLKELMDRVEAQVGDAFLAEQAE
jgi:hypothetical protein